MAKKVSMPSQLKPHKQQFPRSVSASSSVYILSANVPTERAFAEHLRMAAEDAQDHGNLITCVFSLPSASLILAVTSSRPFPGVLTARGGAHARSQPPEATVADLGFFVCCGEPPQPRDEVFQLPQTAGSPNGTRSPEPKVRVVRDVTQTTG
ncbi:hypothetical protein MRX96_025388 [Rhipicephalus microplus]